MPFVQQFQHSVDTIKLNVGIRTLSEMKFMRFPQLNCIFEGEGGGNVGENNKENKKAKNSIFNFV